eukprot:847870-Alexandrium_andersonii.AAC.1
MGPSPPRMSRGGSNWRAEGNEGSCSDAACLQSTSLQLSGQRSVSSQTVLRRSGSFYPPRVVVLVVAIGLSAQNGAGPIPGEFRGPML